MHIAKRIQIRVEQLWSVLYITAGHNDQTVLEKLLKFVCAKFSGKNAVSKATQLFSFDCETRNLKLRKRRSFPTNRTGPSPPFQTLISAFAVSLLKHNFTARFYFKNVLLSFLLPLQWPLPSNMGQSESSCTTKKGFSNCKYAMDLLMH